MTTIAVIKVTDDWHLLSTLFDAEFAQCHAGKVYRALMPKDIESDTFDRPSFPIGTFEIMEEGLITVRESAEKAGTYWVSFTGRIEKDGYFGNHVGLAAETAKLIVTKAAEGTNATLDLGENIPWASELESLEFTPTIMDLRDPLKSIVQRNRMRRTALTGQSV